VKARLKATGLTTILALAISVAGATHSQGKQAISTSLSECSVIFVELAEVGLRRNKPQDSVEKISATASAFFKEAILQAQREGRAAPKDYVAAEYHRLLDKWQGRFGKITYLSENKDWVDYCRALGKSRKIPLP